MYRNSWFRLSTFCGAVVIAQTTAVAVPITFYFTGLVTSVDPALVAEFSVGESVVGSYTFESTTPDILLGDPSIGFYDNAITDFAATIGGDYTVTQGANNDLFVFDDTPDSDLYVARLQNPVASSVASLPIQTFHLSFTDTDATEFASDALPLTPPDISGFELDTSAAGYTSNITLFMEFQLASLTLTPIPEPTTCGLAMLATLGLVVGRRRRR